MLNFHFRAVELSAADKIDKSRKTSSCQSDPEDHGRLLLGTPLKILFSCSYNCFLDCGRMRRTIQ